jgi:hypothetical protein
VLTARCTESRNLMTEPGDDYTALMKPKYPTYSSGSVPDTSIQVPTTYTNYSASRSLVVQQRQQLVSVVDDISDSAIMELDLDGECV